MNARLPSKSSLLGRPKSAALKLRDFTAAMVDPEFGINLGYLARTTANFGMQKLLVVSQNKLDEKNASEALLFAAHGRPLIERLEYVPSFVALRKRFDILVGTTAIEGRRRANLTRRTFTPESCAQMVLSRLHNHPGKRIKACFIFGRDTTGLRNEELRACDYNLTIRTGSDYNTLNVSHAAAIVYYAFANSLASRKAAENKSRVKDISSAAGSRKERERVVSLFMRLAEDAEFQPFKRDLLRQTLERALNRSEPSMRELYLLMGVASKADSKIRRLST
jgi:tRNA/rRNA methyltransferase